jgi:hypothetical protein
VADPATIDLSQIPAPPATPDGPQSSLLVVPSLSPVPDGLDFSGGAYLGAGAVTTYHWNYGLTAQPLAGPIGTPCKIVRLHAPVCFKRVIWVVQRVIDKPALPHPDTLSNGNEVLLDNVLSPTWAGKTPDGSPVFTVSGIYVYVCQVPPSDTDSLPMGVSPVNTDPASQYVLNPSDFVRSLIPTAPVSGASGLTINF